MKNSKEFDVVVLLVAIRNSLSNMCKYDMRINRKPAIKADVQNRSTRVVGNKTSDCAVKIRCFETDCGLNPASI